LSFTIYGLMPFRLGWLLWAICIAISVLTPFLLDETYAWESSKYARLPRAVVTSLCLTAIAAQLLLGVIRGEVMRQQLTVVPPAVVLEDDARTGAQREPTVYDRTQWYLRLFLPLLALAMELGAGWALWKARGYGTESEDDPDQLRLKRREIQQEMISHAAELKAREAEGAEFEERFRRDFSRAVLNRARKGALRRLPLPIVLLLLALYGHEHVLAQDRVNLVVAVDLTGSVAKARGLDGKTEPDRDTAGVSQVLASAPAGAKVTVIGITDKSFSQPYVLLSAQIASDEGYFKERIALVRQMLVQSWQKRCTNPISRFQRTDLLGSLLVAAQLFQTSPGWRNVLVIFSDMRDTYDLDLNSATIVPVRAALKQAENNRLIADLKGVEVYVLGVDGAQKEIGYWRSLREFWVVYFKKSGADLRSYSMLREIPDLVR
jgi:hypothetical protein